MSHLSWKQFACWNALASAIWAAAFTGAGYLYGDVLGHMRRKTEVVAGGVHQMTLGILGLFLLIVFFRLAVVWCQNRQKK